MSNILKEIEELKIKLVTTYSESEQLTNPKLVMLSQELDRRLNEIQDW